MSFETLLFLAPIGAIIVVVAWYAYLRWRLEHDRSELELEAEPSLGPPAERADARLDPLEIRPLGRAAHHRYSEEWASVQAMFVDDPINAVEQAHGLVQDVMRARGYPVADFEERAADVSVRHPTVVEHYREAHAIATAQRGDRGDGDTEVLRRAFVHYRALFADLLDNPARGRGRRPVSRMV